jgi:hypothetical protein
VGTILSQNIPELESLAVGPNSSLVPDLDLHAYAVDGRHICMNYVTGKYENQIEGAIASGDLSGANEWIFVPQGIKVNYSVSSKDIGDYLQIFPSLEEKYSQISFNVTYSSFDN